MNNKILLILMVMLGFISCKNSQIIEYPKMDNYGSIRVHKIELTDTAAVIHVGAYSFKDYWFNLEGKDGEYYLEGSTTGRRYSLIGTDGIETNKRYTLDESGVMLFSLRFEPIAKEEEAVDVILDSSESLNIRGLSLRQPERTRTRRINGSVVGDKTKAVILIREDLFQMPQTLETLGIVIPVIDGKFQVDFQTEGDDFYTLIAWEQYAIRRFYTCDFLVDENEVDVLCDFENPSNNIISGEVNQAIKIIKGRQRDISDPYDKQLEKLEEQGFYYSETANDILSRAKAEPDRDKMFALYNQLRDLPDSIKFCKEYWAVASQQIKAEIEIKRTILEEAVTNPSLEYIRFVYSLYNYLRYSDRYDLLQDEIISAAELYAEKFADNNMGRVLAEMIESSKIKVGAEYIDFEAPDMEGRMFRFSEMVEGSRIVILDMWASWCGPCRRTAMKNIPIYNQYKDKGLCVVSIARETKNINDLKKAVEQDGYTWPVLVELDDRLNLWSKYNIANAAGGVFVIDPATKKIIAVSPSVEEIEALVKEYCE